jgi:hypothetical protein
MKKRLLTASIRRIVFASGAIALALVSSGASTHEYSIVSKDDRLESVADCRDPEMIARDTCSGVQLPETTTESYTVMPGLTIAEQVSG